MDATAIGIGDGEGEKMAREKKTETETVWIDAIKGFDRDLKCRGFEFEVGKTYEHEGDVEICASGFHAVENPMDLMGYYMPMVDGNRVATVAQSGKIARHDEDSKIASAILSVRAEITFPDFVGRAVAWMVNRVKGCPGASSGNYSKHASSGKGSQHASSGNYSKHASSGHYSQHEATGQHSVISAAGKRSVARGCAGTWVSLAEYDADGHCIGFATGCIGENGLRPDTWYRAENGFLREVA